MPALLKYGYIHVHVWDVDKECVCVYVCVYHESSLLVQCLAVRISCVRNNEFTRVHM